MIARIEDMPPFKRLNTRRPNSTTATIVRTNLRRVREMQGLTRDQAIARIEQPTITTTALGKAETGDRNITAIELAQLAVAYQTPVQSFFVPWGNQRSATPSLSGADFRTGLRESQKWLLDGVYPGYPDAITHSGSAIQGALNTRIFTNPQALLELDTDPSPENYIRLILKELDVFLQPLDDAIKSLTKGMTELCGFDPLPYFYGHTPSKESGYWPEDLDAPLTEHITSDPTEALTKLESLQDTAQHLEAKYLYQYDTDCQYSTIEELWHIHETIKERTKPISYFPNFVAAVTYSYKHR